MNGKKVFKRITYILAIVIAVTCGFVAGFVPLEQYNYTNPVVADTNFRIVQLEKELAKAEEANRTIDKVGTGSAEQGDNKMLTNLSQQDVIKCKEALENERKRIVAF